MSDRTRGSQKRLELLGEDVMFTHVEPRLRGKLFLYRSGLRDPAKLALRQQTQLIVVVADDPPVSRHAEILQQHVTRENVGSGEVLDGVAVVDHDVACGGFAGVPEKDVERGDAALGVDVSHDDPVSHDAHGSAGDAKQVLQQVIREAAARKLEVLELLRVGEAPDSVAYEHEMVLLHDRLTGRVLGRGEPVLDDLEDEIRARAA